ncbi:unnamed protein product [Lactuca virosa]|uniref:Uncharacterized protein n=1 Tax=Lactuca virosa TaxID=75947 RepID=A0AAU9MMC1_9ASTR|nr:unnamed protein product [Lactuca virosa]
MVTYMIVLLTSSGPKHARALAVIDWKDSKFEKDMLYEDIYAPQWIDFSNHDAPVDDEAWFYRPDCDHPKTVEDFFRQRTPNSAKLPRSVSVSEIPEFSDRNRRDAALKNCHPRNLKKWDLLYSYHLNQVNGVVSFICLVLILNLQFFSSDHQCFLKSRMEDNSANQNNQQQQPPNMATLRL